MFTLGCINDQERKDFKLLKPASAPPSPSSTRASTPQASDAEEDDDTHLFDEDEDGGIQFRADKPSGVLTVTPTP